MKTYILAHDSGTGGNKAVIYDQDGNTIASVFEEYESIHPQPNWAVQRPLDWWRVFKSTTRKVLEKSKVNPKDIAAIGISGQQLGCAPMKKDGTLLSDTSIIWYDSRAVEQAQRFLKNVGEDKWYQLTGGGLRPENYSGPKIAWIKENQPEVYKQADVFIGTKDYLNFRMTGNIFAEYAEATGSAVMDIHKWAYDETLAKACGIDLEKLAPLRRSIDVVGKITKEAAEELGLVEGIPVVAGSGDVSATAAGSGAVAEGRIYNYIGTSSWIAVSSAKPMLLQDIKPYIFCHCVPDQYVSNVSIYCAGNAFRWIRDVICEVEKKQAIEKGIDPYDLISEMAAKIAPGAEGLMFFPSMMGGSTITRNPNTAGAFIGLRIGHNRAHLARAALEGISFDLKLVLDLFEKMVPKFSELRLTGGGSNGALWRQILANIYQKTILVPTVTQETAALGAALVAGVGVGLWDSFMKVDEISTIKSRTEVQPDKLEQYEKLASLYKETALLLNDTYTKLAEVNNLV
jgi:xylulokinase